MKSVYFHTHSFNWAYISLPRLHNSGFTSCIYFCWRHRWHCIQSVVWKDCENCICRNLKLSPIFKSQLCIYWHHLTTYQRGLYHLWPRYLFQKYNLGFWASKLWNADKILKTSQQAVWPFSEILNWAGIVSSYPSHPRLWSSSHLPLFSTVAFPDLLLSWHLLQVLLPFTVPFVIALPFTPFSLDQNTTSADTVFMV